jgi:hypothetical protein
LTTTIVFGVGNPAPSVVGWRVVLAVDVGRLGGTYTWDDRVYVAIPTTLPQAAEVPSEEAGEGQTDTVAEPARDHEKTTPLLSLPFPISPAEGFLADTTPAARMSDE